MPKYPIYVDLLPTEAQEVIGVTHIDGIGARKLLEAEGFRYDRVIDIFDGGPTMSAPRDHLLSLKSSRVLRVKSGKPGSVRALLSNENFAAFRACAAQVTIDDADNTLVAETGVLAALEVSDGDNVRFIEN